MIILLIIDLVNLILQKYGVKISHQNSHNFNVHFCNEKKSESYTLIYLSRVIGQAERNIWRRISRFGASGNRTDQASDRRPGSQQETRAGSKPQK